MLHRRILYCLTLAGVLLFQITNDNYLAHFLLVLTAALPLLSLLLSLPGMAQLTAEPADVPRGGTAQWSLSVESRSGLPLPRLTARLQNRNLHTGQTDRQKLSLSGVVRRRPICQTADTAHCGLLEFSVSRVRVCDYLGLFSIHCPAPEPARLLSQPIPVDPGPLNLPEGQGTRPAGRTPMRRGPSEDYDLRAYRPGDPMRSVHWKLSSKWDDLIVREPADAVVPLPLLTFDRFGTPDDMDRVLDRLLGLSRALLAVQRPHAVQWLNEDGQPVFCPVSDEKDLRDCLLALLSVPLPASGPSLLDHPELLQTDGGPVCRLHIVPGEEDDHG